MTSDNAEAYDIIHYVIDNATMGFFVAVAPSPMQNRIANLYTSRRTAVYNYSELKQKFSYSDLSLWADSQADRDILFILNMENALSNDESLASFNMSRDLLAKKNKVWIFLMTKETEYRLSTFAHDIYSCVKLKAYFTEEQLEDFESAETHERLKQYREIEERYMALPLEDTPHNQLLSAAITLSTIAELYDKCADKHNAARVRKKVNDIKFTVQVMSITL